MSLSRILLRNGTVLKHDSQDQIQILRNTDVLIVGNHIESIGQALCVENNQTKVIDCSDKIVSPGLVDTHHHLWQTQLKGRFGDLTLLEYVISGMLCIVNWQEALTYINSDRDGSKYSKLQLHT